MSSLKKKILYNKKMVIYGVIFAVILAANIFMFFKNFSSPELENEDLVNYAAAGGNTLIKQQSAQVKALLENNLFNTLKKIGDWPVKPSQQIGKPDPFIPFFTSR